MLNTHSSGNLIIFIFHVSSLSCPSLVVFLDLSAVSTPDTHWVIDRLKVITHMLLWCSAHWCVHKARTHERIALHNGFHLHDNCTWAISAVNSLFPVCGHCWFSVSVFEQLRSCVWICIWCVIAGKGMLIIRQGTPFQLVDLIRCHD